MEIQRKYYEYITITYDPQTEDEAVEKFLSGKDTDFVSRRPKGDHMVLVEKIEMLSPYEIAIDRLNHMASELDPLIEAEQDVDKKTRLIKERLTCSDAASFLLNDEEGQA